MGVGQAGFHAELAATEEAAGFVVQVGYALCRFRVVLERLPVGTARGARCAGSYRLATFGRFGGRFGQAFGSGCRRCLFDLSNALLEDHQRVLLCFVTLFQLHEFLF
ncbi:hypothetical protein D3C76_1646050 [compost metagenome]